MHFCLCPQQVYHIMFGQAGILPDRQFIQTCLFSGKKILTLDEHQLFMLIALGVSGQALACFPTVDTARETTWPLVKRLIYNVMRFFDSFSKALCLNSLFCRDSKGHLEEGQNLL